MSPNMIWAIAQNMQVTNFVGMRLLNGKADQI